MRPLSLPCTMHSLVAASLLLASLFTCVSPANGDSYVSEFYNTFATPTFNTTSFDDVKKHLLRGRPFVVHDGARGLPMASWSCDFVKKEVNVARSAAGCCCCRVRASVVLYSTLSICSSFFPFLQQFPGSRIRQEGGQSDINDIPMTSDWTGSQQRHPQADRFPEGAPKMRPFYWDIAKVV